MTCLLLRSLLLRVVPLPRLSLLPLQQSPLPRQLMQQTPLPRLGLPSQQPSAQPKLRSLLQVESTSALSSLCMCAILSMRASPVARSMQT